MLEGRIYTCASTIRFQFLCKHAASASAPDCTFPFPLQASLAWAPARTHTLCLCCVYTRSECPGHARLELALVQSACNAPCPCPGFSFNKVYTLQACPCPGLSLNKVHTLQTCPCPTGSILHTLQACPGPGVSFNKTHTLQTCPCLSRVFSAVPLPLISLLHSPPG